jgi:hypothetical protein
VPSVRGAGWILRRVMHTFGEAVVFREKSRRTGGPVCPWPTTIRDCSSMNMVSQRVSILRVRLFSSES